jgi:hypothetical protein
MKIIFAPFEAVQQFKIGRKREANRALNPKRSKIFGVKSNCGTASFIDKNTKLNRLADKLTELPLGF